MIGKLKVSVTDDSVTNMSGRERTAGFHPINPSTYYRWLSASRRPSRRVEQAPGPISSFVRFVVCGGGVTLLSSGVLVLLSPSMNLVVANALVTVLGTLLATELHGRVSFKSERRGWRMHGESALTALAAYLVTTVAMLTLHQIVAHPDVLLDQGVYLVASGVAGTGRFLTLRLIVFARRARPDVRDVALAA